MKRIVKQQPNKNKNPFKQSNLLTICPHDFTWTSKSRCQLKISILLIIEFLKLGMPSPFIQFMGSLSLKKIHNRIAMLAVNVSYMLKLNPIVELIVCSIPDFERSLWFWFLVYFGGLSWFERTSGMILENNILKFKIFGFGAFLKKN